MAPSELELEGGRRPFPRQGARGAGVAPGGALGGRGGTAARGGRAERAPRAAAAALGVLARQLHSYLLSCCSSPPSRRRRRRPHRGRDRPRIVAMSVGLGFVNEYRSERAVDALHAQIRRVALVAARRRRARGARDRARPGRRRPPAGRRRRAGRPAPSGGARARVRRVGAHRRGAAGCEVDGGGHRRIGARPAVVRVDGDGRPRRRGARRRRPYRHANSLRADRAAASASGRRPPSSAACTTSRACSSSSPRARRLDLRGQRRARPLDPAVGPVRARDRRRPDAAALAGDRHRQPLDRRPAARRAAR